MKVNPLIESIELTKQGREIISFSKGTNSPFEKNSYLLCSPDVIHDVFVKKHKYFTETIHPFRETQNLLSSSGLKALRLRSFKENRENEEVTLYKKLEKFQQKFLSVLSSNKDVDLYYELSLLSLNFSLMTLFDYHDEDIARNFLDCSIEFEDFLTQMRRGNLRDQNDEELMKIKKTLFRKQYIIVESILSSLGHNEVNDQTVRSFIRTVLNTYVGTGTSFFWSVYLLWKYPDSKESLFKEVKEVEVKDFSSFEDMPLLDSFLKESLRLYPTAWMLTREAQKNDIISTEKVEESSLIHVCLYSLHRDPNYWSDPEEFKIDRFINLEDKSQKAFLPFGIGPRKCVGEKFAYLILKTFLKGFISGFEADFTSSNSFSPVPKVALQPYPLPFVKILRKKS